MAGTYDETTGVLSGGVLTGEAVPNSVTDPGTPISQGTDPVYGTREWTGTDADGNALSGTEDYIMTEGTNPSISKNAQDVAKAQGVTYEGLANEVGKERTEEYIDPTTGETKTRVVGAFDDPAYSYNADKTQQELMGGVTRTEILDENGNGTGRYRTTTDGTGKVVFNPGTDYVDSAKSTVAGQLNTILNPDNSKTVMGEYIQGQETAAKNAMQGRGMLNSTMAAQAGRSAAIGGAMQAAQQDAQTYAQAQGLQQGAEYGIQTMQGEAITSGNMVTQKSNQTQRAQDIQNYFDSLKTGANAQNATWVNDLQNIYNVGLENIRGDVQKAIAEYQMSGDMKIAYMNSVSEITESLDILMEKTLSDPDMTAALANYDGGINGFIGEWATIKGNEIKMINSTFDPDTRAILNNNVGDWWSNFDTNDNKGIVTTPTP